MRTRWALALLSVVAMLLLPSLSAAQPPGSTGAGGRMLPADLLRADGTLDLTIRFRGRLE